MKKKSPKSTHYSRYTFVIISHARALKQCILLMLKKPLSTSITAFVIGITIALPVFLSIILHDFQSIAASWQDKPNLSIYLKRDATHSQTQTLIHQLNTNIHINQVQYISPTQGLKELKEYSEFSDILPLLTNNPLPPVITVSLKQLQNTNTLHVLLPYIQNLSFVDQTRLDSQWIERMHYALQVANRIVFTIAGLLAIGVILVVSNTIHLMTQSHQHEMYILKLAGATNRYIRRPFLYNGLLYGVLGGGLASTLVILIDQWIAPPAMALLESYQVHTTFTAISPLTAGVITLSAVLMSLIGAWLAIQQHLKKPI